MYWCLEEDMKCLSDWFKANLLTLNLSKSVAMTFGKNKFAGRNIKVGDTCLQEVTHTKFLGVWIDKKLDWTTHLSKLFMKLKQNIYLLKASKHVLSLHAKKNLYYAQIYSHLSYGLVIWGNMLNKGQLNKLQSIQNKCFKLVTGEEATPANYHKNGMLNLTEMILLMNLKHGHRIQHSHLPKRILECSKLDSGNRSLVKTHQYSMRHKNSLNIPRSNCINYRRSYLYQSIVSYQKLSKPLKEISNEKLFIAKCKYLILHDMLNA